MRAAGVEELVERGEVLGGERFGDGAADALQAAEGTDAALAAAQGDTVIA